MTRHAFGKCFFTVDALATLGLAIWAIHYHHYAMLACGLAAVMSDFLWVAHVIKHRSFDLTTANSRFGRWHKKIQTHEFPDGLWIELPLAVIINLPYILHTFIKLGRSESEIQEDDRKAVTRVWCEDSFGVVSE
ncbi:MAG: hypothetical protein WBP03_00245, partial [Candidatus Saccharimonadales bacterium]